MSASAITIRRSTPNDAAAIAQFMSHPEVFAELLQLPYPTEAMWKERLSAQRAATDVSLAAEIDGAVVGSASLHGVAHLARRRHAAGMGISVAHAAQGQGIGNALMQALLEYADRWAGLLRVELTVYTSNTRAIALYKKHGFQVEGEHKAFALKNGQFVDALYMARLHPNPPRM